MFPLLCPSSGPCLVVRLTPILLLRAFSSGGKLPQDFQQPGFDSWEDIIPLPPPVYRFWGPWWPRTLAFLKHDGSERPGQLLAIGLGGRWGGLKRFKRASVPENQAVAFSPALGGLATTRVRSQNGYIVASLCPSRSPPGFCPSFVYSETAGPYSRRRSREIKEHSLSCKA